MHWKKAPFFVFILTVVISIYACEKEDNNGPSGDNNSDGLSENEQMLIGTWLHTYTKGGISPGPVDYATITWTFNADGSATYYQNPDNSPEQTSDMYWKLDGNDIVFTDEQGIGDPNYRVDQWGEDTMEWYNYTLEDTYVVEKQ